MNWKLAHQIFERAFAAKEMETVHECVEELLRLGLTKAQINGGLIAGILELAKENGISQDMIQEFRAYAKAHPRDAKIIIKVVFEEAA